MTQFEVATAAAFVAFAAARVEAAVIEAGLGGRLDATNTIPSRVTVLTSVGLDHTEWLGDTELEIAAEKLAVLRDATTLVLGRVSAPRSARWPSGPPPSAGRRWSIAAEDPGEDVRLRAPGASSAATSRSPWRRPRPSSALLDPEAGSRAGGRDPDGSRAASSCSPRIRRPSSTPPTTPTAPRALAEALPEVAGGRR